MSEAVVEKAINRLQAAVESGSAYEGLQTVKSVYHRCRSRKQLEASYSLAQHGAECLMRADEVSSASELAKMLTEAYVADAVPATSAACSRILTIIDAAQALIGSLARPQDLSKPHPAESACQTMTFATIKWARGQQGAEAEIQQLHQRMGNLVWSCRSWHGLATAAEHYCRGDNIFEYASVLAECVSAAGADAQEESWFLLRAVLQMLIACKPNARALKANAVLATEQGLSRAAQLLKAYREVTGRELPDGPQIHLILLLFEAFQRQNGKLLDCILAVHEPWLKRNPEMHQAVAAVTSSYSIHRQQAGGDLLADLFQMIGNG